MGKSSFSASFLTSADAVTIFARRSHPDRGRLLILYDFHPDDDVVEIVMWWMDAGT